MSKLWSNVEGDPADGPDLSKRHFVNPTQCMSKLGCGIDDEAVDTSDKLKRHFVNPTQCMSKLGCGMDDASSDGDPGDVNAIVGRSIYAIEPRLPPTIHDPHDQGHFAMRRTDGSAYHHAGLVMLYALFVFLIALPFIYLLFAAKKRHRIADEEKSVEQGVGKGRSDKGEQSV